MAGEKGSSYANSLLLLIFNGTTFTSMANNATVSPFGNLYVSLHTADPTAGGNQSSNEVSYTSYGRVGVARSSSGWTVSGNSVTPVSAISFTPCSGGTATATNWAVGTSQTGNGVLLYTGTLTPSIQIANGVTPIIANTSSITES